MIFKIIVNDTRNFIFEPRVFFSLLFSVVYDKTLLDGTFIFLFNTVELVIFRAKYATKLLLPS